MQPIPAALGKAYADADLTAIDAWWQTLSEKDQQDLATLCDDRLDKCFFGVISDDGKHVIPKVKGGRFIPRENDPWGLQEWGPGYFEHLLNHPELVLVWDPTQRTFHTGCTRHPNAQACWSSGHVPKDFSCPFKDPNCLMKPFLGLTLSRQTLIPATIFRSPEPPRV